MATTTHPRRSGLSRPPWARRRQRAAAEIDAELDRLRARSRTGLHLGCGSRRIAGLTNVDLFHPEADLCADATDLPMFEDGSVDWIETHHMLEHLSLAEADRALDEWARLLAPGGRLVITCPDITAVSRLWLRQSLLHRLSPRREALDATLRMFVGPQVHPGMFHRNAFDARRLTALLEERGLVVERAHTPYPIRPTPSLLVVARRDGPRAAADR